MSVEVSLKNTDSYNSGELRKKAGNWLRLRRCELGLFRRAFPQG